MLSKVTRWLCTIAWLSAWTHALTCDQILELPPDRRPTTPELQMTSPKDIVQCMAHLGREQLNNEEATYIWTTVVNFFEGVSNVPNDVLMLLHWVAAAIPPGDYSNMTLSNIDVIQNFGLNYKLNEAQISALADRVREDFAGKEPEDYTYYDLTALRQILCGFNKSEIERIHPAAYREAALILSKLENCDPSVLAGFATLAVQKEAFGPSSTWSEATWEMIGSIRDYVSADTSQRPAVLPTQPTVKDKIKKESLFI